MRMMISTAPWTAILQKNHIENQLMKPEPNESWLSNAELIAPTRTQLLVKLLFQKAMVPTRGRDAAACYHIYTYKKIIPEPRTRKLVNTRISIATPNTRMDARIAHRYGLSVKGLDIGAGVVDSDYLGAIKVLLINNSNMLFHINTGDRMAQLILE